jgi:histidinol-phosphate aminotransferase
LNIDSLVRPNIRSLKAYKAKEIPCRVKLDANESPYGFAVSPSAIKKIRTNRYPDPEAKALKKILAKGLGVSPENILPGNGSDEIIYYLIMTFGGPVLYPTPTFSMYGIISQALGNEKAEVPLDDKFDIDIEKTLREIKRKRPKMIFLSSPNNPTGNSFSADKMIKIIESSGGIVVVDEAYQSFSGRRSFIPLIKKYENLVVLRTLSKIGLAGLRAGMLIAGKRIISEVNKVRLPFNLNSFSQAIASVALKDKRRMNSYINKIIFERKRLYREMCGIKGVLPYPSDANFILFGVRNAKELYRRLLEEGVLVRELKELGCLRVTVGTKRENTIFLKALKEAII